MSPQPEPTPYSRAVATHVAYMEATEGVTVQADVYRQAVRLLGEMDEAIRSLRRTTDQAGLLRPDRPVVTSGRVSHEQLDALISLAHTVHMWQEYGSDTELHDAHTATLPKLQPLIDLRDAQLRQRVAVLDAAMREDRRLDSPSKHTLTETAHWELVDDSGEALYRSEPVSVTVRLERDTLIMDTDPKPQVDPSDPRLQVGMLLGLVRDLVGHESEPCSHDHHGYCQAHALEERCSVARGRAVLGLKPGEKG